MPLFSSRSPSSTAIARLESGTVRASPFLVSGSSAIWRLVSMLSQVRESSSPRLMAVSIANWTMGLSHGLREPWRYFLPSSRFSSPEWSSRDSSSRCPSSPSRRRSLAWPWGGRRIAETGFSTSIINSRRAQFMTALMIFSSRFTVLPAAPADRRRSRQFARIRGESVESLYLARSSRMRVLRRIFSVSAPRLVGATSFAYRSSNL